MLLIAGWLAFFEPLDAASHCPQRVLEQCGSAEQANASEQIRIDLNEVLASKLERMLHPCAVEDTDCEYSEDEIAHYDRYHIEPFNLAREKCTDGTCTIAFDGPRPYEACEDEDLQEKALDPLANLYYAMRMPRGQRSNSDYQQLRKSRIDRFLRAAALSGKPGPIIWLLDSEIGNGERVEIDRQNGHQATRYDLDELATYAALHALAASMGDPRAQPQFELMRLRAALAGAFPTETVTYWETRVTEHVLAMQDTMQRFADERDANGGILPIDDDPCPSQEVAANR